MTNELLPVIEHGERLIEFLRAHPEAEYFHNAFYGDGIVRELYQAGADVQRKIYNARDLQELLTTYEERTHHLAARHCWN